MTRMGNSGHPREHGKLSQSFRLVRAEASRDQPLKPLEQRVRLCRVFPTTAPVISEADAREMAQPDPWNVASLMTSPSIRSQTRT